MRRPCQYTGPMGECDKPAVDHYTLADGTKIYLCAEHWDRHTGTDTRFRLSDKELDELIKDY
jgi:hypothetical protein